MPQLSHFQTTLQDSSGNAISGGTATIYRQGATVSGAQSGTSPLTVTVRHPNKLKASDTVFVGTTTGTTYNVNSTTDTTVVLSGFAGTLVLANGDILVPSNNKPTIYGDDLGGASTTNPLTSDSTGFVQCWLAEKAVHYIALNAAGGAAKLRLKHLSSALTPALYADDFIANSTTAGIQEALDALPSTGGQVRLGPKTYSITASTSIWLPSNTKLLGSGVGATIIQRATGSITDGGASNSGAVIACGPSAGTLFTAASAGTNISLSDLTLDGNQSNFSSLTNTALGCAGFRASFVDGLFVHNVRAQNVLQDGFRLDACRDFHLSNIYADTVGQWSVASSRNALSLYNSGNDTNYAKNGTVTNFTFKTIGDEALTLTDQNGNIAISNGTVDGCDFVIELGGNGTIDPSGISFSNITSKNCLDFPITINALVGSVYTDITFDNINVICHASSHNAGAISLNAGTANSVSNVHFNNCHFKNLNSLDTTARNWFDVQPGSGATVSRLSLNNCSFSGKSGSTRATDIGINLRGAVQNVMLDGVLLKDCAGQSIAIYDNSFATTLNDVHFTDVVVDTSTNFGCVIQTTLAASTIKEVYFNGCVMKDCATQTNNAGFRLLANFAGSSINNIYFNGCRAFKTSGTTMTHGVRLDGTAGTLDNLLFEVCDFSGTQTDWFTYSGTVTNVKFRAPSDRGTDIASAATIAIPPNGEVFHVTGTTNITNGITVNAWDNGRIVSLIFDSTPTLSDTGTSVLSADLVATANDTITLRCDGTNWYELSRSAN